MPPPAAHKHAITPAAAGSTDAPLAVVLQQAAKIGMPSIIVGFWAQFRHYRCSYTATRDQKRRRGSAIPWLISQKRLMMTAKRLFET